MRGNASSSDIHVVRFPGRSLHQTLWIGRDAVGHAMSLGDVVTDTMHQFAPTYQNYVLYSDGTAKMKQGLGTPDNDDGLLYDVEMSNWDDAPREPTAMGKYLRKDSDDTDSPSNQRRVGRRVRPRRDGKAFSLAL
eukprot:jgi/Picre1/28268/NNA_003674.t1